MSVFSHIKLGSEKYPAMTGVRAVGATVVFLDHFPLWPAWHITLNVMAFFFVLSGFLIARIYYETAELKGAWLSKYFINRFARIYPVYFLLLSIAVCLQHDFRPWTLVSNYTLIHALFHRATVIIQPSWSLTVEECFYAMAPLFMVLARRYNFWVPFACACVLLLAALGISELGIAFLGTPAFVLSTTFFGHFAEFFAGFYLALAVMNRERRDKPGNLPVSGARYTHAGLIGVLLLGMASVLVYRQDHVGRAWLINNFLIPVPIAVLYWGLMRETTVLSRVLSTRIFGLLGRSSYFFYLLHRLIIDHVSIPLLLPATYRPLCVTVTLVATWGLSILMFACYEEPVNLFIRRRFRSKDRPVGMQGTLFQANP
jgi:peptidoglycan/LPS O-acetylase OafA/YrhL